MNKLALQQAWERFHRAEAAHKRLANTDVPADIELHWSEFLLAASTVYSKLEKGSKGHSKSEPWFGAIKHTRRNDPLLAYVHHARNADEHGIQRIIEKKAQALRITSVGDGPMSLTGFHIDDDGVFHHHPDNVGQMKVEVKFAIHFAPVKDDRFGDTFNVPKEHLGRAIPDEFPETLSGLTIEYLRGVLMQAAKFVT